VSLGAAPVLLATVEEEWARLAWMVALSSGAAVLAALLAPGTHQEVVAAFVERVRPMGWWPQAEEEQQPLRALLQRLGVAALLSASLFLALAGSVRLLAPLPEGSGPWPWCAFVAAVFLVPLWWRGLRALSDS